MTVIDDLRARYGEDGVRLLNNLVESKRTGLRKQRAMLAPEHQAAWTDEAIEKQALGDAVYLVKSLLGDDMVVSVECPPPPPKPQKRRKKNTPLEGQDTLF